MGEHRQSRYPERKSGAVTDPLRLKNNGAGRCEPSANPIRYGPVYTTLPGSEPSYQAYQKRPDSAGALSGFLFWLMLDFGVLFNEQLNQRVRKNEVKFITHQIDHEEHEESETTLKAAITAE